MTTVTSVMTANPASATPETPLRDVARLMIENDCGQIPVVDTKGMPVGVVTDRDIAVRIVAEGRDTMNATASDAMSGPVQSVREDSTLKDAAELMEAVEDPPRAGGRRAGQAHRHRVPGRHRAGRQGRADRQGGQGSLGTRQQALS